MLAACWWLCGCHDPVAAPLDLFHDLQGGAIAAQRPPPPGAGLPYPKLGTVPAKPTLPDPAYRNSLQAQLLAERDRTQRIAADRPVLPLVPPSPPALPAPPPQQSANPAPPGAEAAATDLAQPAVAAATLQTAEAPPPAPPPPPADFGPAPGAPLILAGAPLDEAVFPNLPAVPPPPAAFEGVPAEPLPTMPILPVATSPLPAGTPVFFPEGTAALPASQRQALKDFLAHRHRQSIEVIGLGEAVSDTPDGQAAALALGLKRAQAVADALAAMHVPQSAMRVGANAFGRGAVLRLL